MSRVQKDLLHCSSSSSYVGSRSHSKRQNQDLSSRLLISKAPILDLCVHVCESYTISLPNTVFSAPHDYVSCKDEYPCTCFFVLFSVSPNKFPKVKLLASMWKVLITKLPFIKVESIYIFTNNYENPSLCIFSPFITLKMIIFLSKNHSPLFPWKMLGMSSVYTVYQYQFQTDLRITIKFETMKQKYSKNFISS